MPYRITFGRAAIALAVLSPQISFAQGQATAAPLTRSAFIATMDAEYAKLDANHDGVVTKPELQAQQARIASAAAALRAQRVFAQIDTDHNGQISLAEFTKATARMVPVDATAVMNRLDTNHDQKVTLVEYRILTLANFDRLDLDRDGVLTPAEQRAGGLGK